MRHFEIFMSHVHCQKDHFHCVWQRTENYIKIFTHAKGVMLFTRIKDSLGFKINFHHFHIHKKFRKILNRHCDGLNTLLHRDLFNSVGQVGEVFKKQILIISRSQENWELIQWSPNLEYLCKLISPFSYIGDLIIVQLNNWW